MKKKLLAIGLAVAVLAEVVEVECALLARIGGFKVDVAERALIFDHVVLEGQEEALRVVGGHDYAADDFRLLEAGEGCSEIDYELAVRMCDERKVGIYAFRHFWLYVYTERLLVVVVHI